MEEYLSADNLQVTSIVVFPSILFASNLGGATQILNTFAYSLLFSFTQTSIESFICFYCKYKLDKNYILTQIKRGAKLHILITFLSMRASNMSVNDLNNSILFASFLDITYPNLIYSPA